MSGRSGMADEPRARRVAHDSTLSRDALDRLRTDPVALLDSGAMLKDGDRSTVVRIDLDGRPLVLKRYQPRGMFHAITHAMLTSRAQRCYDGARRLREADVPTPAAIAVVHERFGEGAWLLQEFIAGAMLHDAVAACGDDDDAIDVLAFQVAAIWSQLAEVNAVHDDLKAANFIVDGDERVWLIDLDGVRFGLPGPLYQRARAADLESHFKSWREMPRAHERFAAAFHREDEATEAILARLTLR